MYEKSCNTRNVSGVTVFNHGKKLLNQSFVELLVSSFDYYHHGLTSTKYYSTNQSVSYINKTIT